MKDAQNTTTSLRHSHNRHPIPHRGFSFGLNLQQNPPFMIHCHMLSRTRRSPLFIFLFLMMPVLCFSQQKIRLSQGWEFLRQDLGGIWEAVRPVGAGNPESVPLWTNVSLPHCYNADDAVDPDLNYYQGPAWYRTTLHEKNPYPGGRTLLHFEGSGQKTDVYIHTTKVGSHVGGYDEFTIDITEAIAAFKNHKAFQQQFKGKIPLSVRTDNSRDLELIPSDLSDFNLYGGIYRHLNLVYVPALSIDKIFASPKVDKQGKSGTLGINARFYNPSGKSNARVSLQLLDPKGKLVKSWEETKSLSSGDIVFNDIVIKKPVLWTTQTPALYKLFISVENEGSLYRDSVNTGFRHFEFAEHGPFYLNGKRLLLRGTHRHEDHAGVAAAMSDEQMRQEMILIKEMGANFIRLGHYQQSRNILDLCDSLGLLVWEEIPWCRGGLGGETFRQQARRMLTNMIEQHYNHPSIILWGLGNENDWPGDFPVFDKDSIRNFMQELHQLSHKLDDSRLTAIRRCDFCKDIVDVYSPSIWAGWYRGIYTDYKSVSETEMKRVKHFLHVEWGGDGHAGRNSESPDNALQKVKPGQADERAGDASLVGGAARVSKDGDWSESYIINLMDWHLKEQETMPWLTGTAQWVFKDFSTPVRPDNPVPYMNQKGLVERDLTKKEAYYVFQSYWAEEPMLRIYGHNWPIRWGQPGEEKMIKVFSNCDEAELFLNGKSMGKRKRNSQDFPAAGLRWNVVFNKGHNAVKVIATKGKHILTDSLRLDYQDEVWGKPAQLKLEKIDEKDGIATVRAYLLDVNGLPCLDARNWIRFKLAGDGAMIQNQGTSSGSSKVQLYNGRAIIRINLGVGVSIVSAQVDSIPTAVMSLKSTSPFFGKMKKVLQPIVMKQAAWAVQQEPVTVTAEKSPRSAGGKHDFYSEGDYWWPDPANADGPYIQKDGQTNPGNFVAHRLAMIRFSRVVGALASAYKITGDEKYVKQAVRHVRAWFIDSSTYMSPHLLYAQAIKGRATGRGIGIIDAIHLMEVVKGMEVLQNSAAMDPNVVTGARQWFTRFLQWLTTHPYGKDEMNAANNHGTCWVMQVSAFAKFVENDTLLKFCRDRYRQVLLPGQMAADGSFPLELKRTKPYGYSLFNLDAMATICQLLSTPEDDLWAYVTPDGRSIRKGIDYLYSFVKDKSKWPLAPDVMYWKEWPVAHPFLAFGATAFLREEWLNAWQLLEHDPKEEEVLRNLPVRNVLIW